MVVFGWWFWDLGLVVLGLVLLALVFALGECCLFGFVWLLFVWFCVIAVLRVSLLVVLVV